MLNRLPVLRYLLRRGAGKPAPQGRPLPCLRCRTAWHAETPCQADAESDNARRKATPTTSAAIADDCTVNRAAGRRECIAGPNAFELIREQAHAALNAIRSGCREDHNRIISRLRAADATPPPYADKSLAAAATLVPRPSLPDAGWDADARIRISRAFAEVAAAATLVPRPSLPDAGWDADARIRISRAFAEALAEAGTKSRDPMIAPHRGAPLQTCPTRFAKLTSPLIDVFGWGRDRLPARLLARPS